MRDAWSAGQRITAALAEKLDAQQAQAANGNVWTDVAMLLNFVSSSALTTRAHCAGWYPASGSNLTGQWITTGVSAGNATASYSRAGLTWTSLTIPAGNGLTPGPYAFAAKADGTIGVFGGTPGSSSASKYRESTDLTTWTARSSSQTDTAGVTSIAWMPFASGGTGLFVAGHTSGKLETSPDAQTWTNRTTPFGAVSIGQVAVNSTTAVVVAINSTAAAYSTNGTTWTSATLPITGSGAVVWNSVLNKFFAFGTTGATICSSSDGITWSATGLTGPGGLATTSYAVSSGRLLLSSPGQTGVLAYSTDAINWKYSEALGITAPTVIAVSNDGQLLCKDASSVHIVSLRSY
jgi:hypothetical protein